MSLYDVNSLSNTTSLSITVLDAVISLPNLSALIYFHKKRTNNTKRDAKKDMIRTTNSSDNVVYVCKLIHSNCIRVCDASIRDFTKKKLAVQTSLLKPR